MGPHAPLAFPALAAAETGAGIRLFRTEAEARLAHRGGVRALMALRFRDEVKHLKKAFVPAGDLKVWAAAFGGVKALENALLDKVLHDLFEADVRTPTAFDAHAERIRPQILPRGQEVVKLASPALKALYEATEQIRGIEGANRGNRPLLTFLAGLREEASRLLPADFLIRYDEERLTHIGRYLRALAIRAERGAVHLEKAIERGKEIAELAAWHEETLGGLSPHASEEKRQALEAFAWIIEEYKVSIFAQELKTAIPVSRKRIDAKMGEIGRML